MGRQLAAGPAGAKERGEGEKGKRTWTEEDEGRGGEGRGEGEEQGSGGTPPARALASSRASGVTVWRDGDSPVGTNWPGGGGIPCCSVV